MSYAFSVFLCSSALFCNSVSSLFLFPNSRKSARKNTPRISQGLTQTDIANAPAAALITKFVAIVIMSANASCFSQIVYNCDKKKYPSAVYVNSIGKCRLVSNPLVTSVKASSIASIVLIFPDAIGLFFFSGCLLSFFLSAKSFMVYVALDSMQKLANAIID